MLEDVRWPPQIPPAEQGIPITSREGDFDTVSCIARGSWTPDCYADALSLKLVSFSINLKIAKSVQLIECDKHFWYFEPARYTHDILGSNVYGITKAR